MNSHERNRYNELEVRRRQLLLDAATLALEQAQLALPRLRKTQPDTPPDLKSIQGQIFAQNRHKIDHALQNLSDTGPRRISVVALTVGLHLTTVKRHLKNHPHFEVRNGLVVPRKKAPKSDL